MTINYVCKHCRTELGSLQSQVLDLEQIDWQLLSDKEKQQLMAYHQDQTITFQVICEYCQQLLEQNPQYHELDYFIQ
ncbi:anti-sigma-F factor Fin [Gracilibacillus alcaliphilus]|uniref:anti-sigma-F factor Fin n=1 Tax=Gracilibacillus alcaliphilus TaxID=1401441 RepID=UPI00195B88B0|nr:anti-sigma-F factor Fin [Gracilibacillus alcaliphilus]MBM7678112.1 putative CHY-type Zn-finger protein [Gracilibacillus alcaliphilus]